MLQFYLFSVVTEEKDVEENLFFDYLEILEISDYWAFRWGWDQVLYYRFESLIFLQ